MFDTLCGVGLLDDPTNPYAIESLRRSVAMLTPGQEARIERNRALDLLEELKRLQEQHRTVAGELRAMLRRLEGGSPEGGGPEGGLRGSGLEGGGPEGGGPEGGT
jgi:hypothetical protein